MNRIGIRKGKRPRSARNFSRVRSFRNWTAASTQHGILEVMPDGFGFIRENYLPGENDVYVDSVPDPQVQYEDG